MKDIAMRLLKSGEMSGTADRLIWKLQQMGEHKAVIMKKLARLTGLTTTELKSLLQEAVLTSWEDDLSVYDAIGVPVSSPLDNPVVMSVMDAEYRKSLTELQNLTRTTMKRSQQDLINMLDEAEIMVSSGVQSYSAAVCDILDKYAGQGVKVSYPTGTEISLEAAVRMCVVTSMNQTAAQVTNQYIIESGTNHVLTSAHIGARVKRDGQPDLAGHDLWQGRVFCIVGSEPDVPNLLESTGYGIDPLTGQGKVVNPLGMHGYNCRHGHKPWDKRLKNPWRDEDGNLIDGNGDLITSERNRKAYENQQKQRAYERSIRKTKRELLVKQQEINGVAETDVKSILQDDYDKLANKLQKQNKLYNDFCEQNNLQKQHDRIKVSGFNRSQAAKATQAARRKIDLEEKPIEIGRNSDTIKSLSMKEAADVHFVGKINKDIYKCVTEDIRTEDVVITDERIIHIQERHPNDYERFCSYIPEVIKNPDYIIEANKENTGILLKEIEESGEKFKLVLRIAVQNDPEGYKNSVISFWHIGDTTWRKTLKNKNILYKRE